MRSGEETRYYAITPKSWPTAAVRSIASAPQKVTRTAPVMIDAPPAFAARPPNTAKNISDDAATTDISCASGTAHAVNNGNAAPTVNVPAEAKAA